jgi:hypothetical protein
MKVIFQILFLLVLWATGALATELAGKSQKIQATHTSNSRTTTAPAKEDRAIALVLKRKEVQTWRKNFNGPEGTSRLGGREAYSVEGHEGEIYIVHVFEDLPDHVATFNWYEVNIRTGKVTKQF